MQSLIELERATLGYGRHAVLEEVTLAAASGDFLGIVGPNGSGKTTLLKTMLGTLRPLSGRVSVAEQVAFGYVPQRQAVDETFPLTVREIILMGRFSRIGLCRAPRARDRAIAAECAAHVGITELLDRRYRTLSGGQKQRTLIARALAAEPSVLVLDEPTNGMDLPAEKAMMDLVRRLHDEDGLTVVMVSHLLNVVASYVKRLAIVGAGRVDVGDVEAMLTGERLSALYGTPVQVHQVGRTAVVIAGAER